jgi:hypothetical protein
MTELKTQFQGRQAAAPAFSEPNPKTSIHEECFLYGDDMAGSMAYIEQQQESWSITSRHITG